MSLANVEGAPCRPRQTRAHWYFPFPGIVKAVYGLASGLIEIWKKPDVRSRLLNTLALRVPTLSMHSFMSAKLYLSVRECSFMALRS